MSKKIQLDKKWSKSAKETFFSVFSIMKNQNKFVHPKQELVAKEHWDTIRHNAAWTAAEVYDGNWK